MNLTLLRFPRVPAAAWLVASSLAFAACAGSSTSGTSDDTATADDVQADTTADGTGADAGNDTAAQDVQTGPKLVIDNPLPNGIVSGAFQLQAHVEHPPTKGGPFGIQVADPVSNFVVATATTDDLTQPISSEVSVAGLPGGTYAVRVSVLDKAGALVTSADLVFTVNAPPGAPKVAITPEHPTAADGFAATLTSPSTDPEGDAVTYTYAWKRNGVATADTGSAIAAGSGKKGDVWIVAVTPADQYGKGLTGYAQVLVGNQAPVPATLSQDVTVVDLIGEVSATVATPASDPDGDVTQLTWKWSVNGQPVPGKNTPKTSVPALGTAIGQKLVVGDTITVVQSVTDGLNSAASQPLTWTVGNVAPHLFIDAPTPNSTQTSAKAFDLQGHVENPPAIGGPFTVQVADAVSGYVVSSGEVPSLTSAFTTPVNIAGVPAGTYAVLVSITNAAGAFVASADLVFTVNAPPTAPVVLIQPATPTAADTFGAVLSTPSTDPEGDAITYTYTWTRNGEATGETGATIAAGVAKKNEVWIVTVTPADAYGSGFGGSAYVLVANQVPVPATLASDVTLVDVEGAVSVGLATPATDADGDALLLTWHWAINGEPLADLNVAELTLAQLAVAYNAPIVPGTVISVTQTAFDGQDEATSQAFSWTVGNFQPHLFLDAPAQNATLTSAGPFTVYAHLENPPADGGPFSIVAADAVSGTIVTQQLLESLAGSLALQVDIGGVPDGTYDLQISVRNAAGAVVAARDLLFVVNAPPSQPVIGITPQLPTAADVLTAQIVTEAIDPEGDAIKYSTTWLRNGEPTTYTDATLAAGVAKKGEVWTALTTASDPYGAGWAGTADVLIGNQAPVAAIVGQEVATVGLLGEISATTAEDAHDADGDALGLTWSWWVNGTLVEGKTTASTTVLSLRNALGATIKAGDVITAKVAATDGEATALSNELTWTVTGGDDVCTARPNCGIDAACTNNDSLDPTCTCKNTTIGDGKYCVLVTGLSPTASTFIVSDGTANFTVGGNANVPGNVVVEVIDPKTSAVLSTTTIPGLGGASAIKAVTPETGASQLTVRISRNGTLLGQRTYDVALNHKPTAPQGAFSPVAPDVTNAVSYVQSVASTDADGQTITYKYAWSINSTVNTSLTANNVPAATAKKGDKLTLKVTPNDGVENGPALTLNVTIANAAPSTFAGAFDLTTVFINSTLTVNLTSPPAKDPDGETVTYSYAWFLNDVAISGATAASINLGTTVIPSHTITAGDVLRAEVTATDGTASTVLKIPGVTLQNTP